MLSHYILREDLLTFLSNAKGMIDQIIVIYNILEVVSKNNVKKINFPSQLFIGKRK
jgi:hypothetical protein